MLRNILPAGDSLHITFELGNNNDYLKDAGLHHDLCYLTVNRNGKAMATSLVRAQVSPDNTARMAWRQ